MAKTEALKEPDGLLVAPIPIQNATINKEDQGSQSSSEPDLPSYSPRQKVIAIVETNVALSRHYSSAGLLPSSGDSSC